MKATTPFEPLLRSATIKAIDGVAKKLSAAERSAESKVGKLLNHWNELADEDKERVVGIAIATVTTAVTAIVALKGKKKTKKTPVKKAVKKLAKKVF